MNVVEYVDDEGRRFEVGLPDGIHQRFAYQGARFGPPDLNSLNLPLATEVRLNHQLYARRLFSEKDVRRRPQELFAALQAAFQIDVNVIAALYADKEVR